MTDRILARARPAIRALQPYQPGKPVEELERELGIRAALKLASNENPRGPGPAVHKALARAGEALNRYPDGNGFELKRALAERLDVDPAMITLGNGSNDVLELLGRVFVGPGDRGVVDAHSFVVYPLAITSSGGEIVRVPSKHYGHDLEAMAAAVDARTRIMFVANPNNPTGTRVTEAEVRKFLASVPDDVVVVLDEAYFEYVEAPDHPDGIRLLADHPNLVVTRTFSKIYGLSALRLGWAYCPAAVTDVLHRVRGPFNVNALAQAAGVEAVRDQAFIEKAREHNDKWLPILTQSLRGMGLEVTPSVGNFLLIDFRDSGKTAAEAEQYLSAKGLLLRAVAGYGLPTCLRMTIGLETENHAVIEALRQLLGK